MRRLRRITVEVGLNLVEDALLHLLTLAVEELDAVVVVGVVAGAYHNAAVEVVHTRYVAHAGRGGDVQQVGVRAGAGEPRGERALEHVARTAGVLAYDYLGLVLAAVVPADETPNLEGVLGGQIHIGFTTEAVGSKVF